MSSPPSALDTQRNHVHLLMTPATTEGVPQVMKRVGQRYVQYINRTYQRTVAAACR